MTKVVVITGAAKRIGADIAKAFHQAGYQLALHYRSSKADIDSLIDGFNQERPASAKAYQADLNNVASLEAMAAAIINDYGNIDVLVNNASSFYPTEFGKVTEQQWDDLINSNVKGAYFLSQALYPSLKASQGNIVNIVDIHAEKPLKSYPTYCIAKAGLAMMTKALAKELGPEVRVNGVSPGAILWPEEETLYETQQQDILARIPLGKTGRPDDIANTVLFLADKAPYINGQILAVDGGRTLHC